MQYVHIIGIEDHACSASVLSELKSHRQQTTVFVLEYFVCFNP